MGKTLDDENVSGNDPGYKAMMKKSGDPGGIPNPICVARQRSHMALIDRPLTRGFESGGSHQYSQSSIQVGHACVLPQLS